jgi:LuxR family maltose regulon positive regulatory protein
LDEALTQPVTLIVAPAGAGKSMLLAQWAATRHDLEFIWLSLEPADDDPVRFSGRLLSGIAAIDPDLAELGELVAMHGGGLGAPLIEALGVQLRDLPETVIVLDDLHQLSNATLLTDLGRLVDLLPPQVHLVLATRVDPPIAWSHHRLRRSLTEIRQAELAFDDADSARLLERITGRHLGTDQVAALVKRTEGWAAGLQLAGMMLRLHTDSDQFVAQFSGNDRLIADFLSEEVLEAQPEGRRDFLLRLSVLDEIGADLASLLTGEPAAQLALEELERESMFLVPLDSHRGWYRFHHLFRDLLRFRLRAEDPTAENRLLGAAAAWHLERGDVASAVEYLLRARDWNGAIEVILTLGSKVFERGQMATVIRWIDLVPEPALAGRQDVLLLHGILMVADGQSARAEDLLRRVAADPGASRGEQATAQATLAALVQWRPNHDASLAMARRALQLLGNLDDSSVPSLINLTDPQSLETVATISGGRAHLQGGDTREARAWIERGLATNGASFSIWRVSGLGSLALLEAWCGRTGQAEALAEEALAVARAVSSLTHPSSADAYLALALVYLERGELRRTALPLREGCLRAEANRRTQLAWVGQLETAMLQAADGRPDLASATILSARNEMRAPPPPIVADRLLALQSQLLRLQGSPEQAWRLVRDGASESSAVVFEDVACALTLGQIDRARKVLDGWPTIDDDGPRQTVERLVLWAWLAEAEGTPDAGRGPLTEAMDLAELHSLVEVFVRGGPTVIGLVAELTDTQPAFREVVLQRAGQAIAPVRGVDLADPMTDRELEILSYLPSRLTNTELAEQCYVSVNTIKTHMAHIYRKLDAANRNEAIVRARELGML